MSKERGGRLQWKSWIRSPRDYPTYVADRYGKTVIGLYGSLRNIARRLLECLRYRLIPPDAFDPEPPIQVRLNSS